MQARSSRFLLGAVALMTLSGTARAANPRYRFPTPIFVRLEFDGDVAFPNITVKPTPGLARFTGANFGLTAIQRTQVVVRIQELLEADYHKFNIRFVTTQPPVNNFFTWGIDDTSFIFSDGSCPAASGSCRLFGKAGANPGATDNTGQSIFQPRHARTWAGSLSLPSTSASPSQPSLALGNTLPGGVPVTVENIAQALGNNAAHEIGHLFGLVHQPQACVNNPACFNQQLMITMTEAVEATHDKTFAIADRIALQEAIGARPPVVTDVEGALRDAGAGVMFTRDARVVATVPAGTIGTTSSGRLSFADAQTYAASLDYLGYNDWRLPTVLEPTGAAPCHYEVGANFHLFLVCSTGELGRLDFQPIPSLPSSPFTNFTNGIYWATSFDASSWIFDFAAGVLGQSSPSSALVWPVRTTATLVDNGDGTVTDTERRLMWMRDPGSLNRRTFIDATTGIASLGLAGHTDWRLPRVDSITDHSCDNLDVFATRSSSSGCRQNELAHLFAGWGVDAAAGAPFVMPAGGGPIWFETAIVGVAAQSMTYSFDGGILRTDPLPATLAVVWPVRSLAHGDVPRGTNITVDPAADVVVRFNSVTAPGVLVADDQSLPTILGPVKAFQLTSTASFSGGAVICLRYGDDSTVNTISDVRVGRRSSSGTFDPLPLVAGYPDVINHVVCGRSTALGTFRVMPPSLFP
jgi:hypothetical protein